jgi:glycosyltransferase involved in cell wall biosynthesis
MEKVSLYIPCYNAEKTIGECLEGVMRQSYPIDEILVVNDGSRDKSVEIAKNYPVKIIAHNRNKGLAVSRNAAFKQAKNEFVATIDADCICDKEWLKRLMDVFISDDIAGAGGMLLERHASSLADLWRGIHMAQQWGHDLLENPPFLYGSNSVFRKKAVEKAGFYNEKCKTNYEDVELSERLYHHDFRLIYDPRARVEHLRKDTVSSVLSSYWGWVHYKHAHAVTFDKKLGGLALTIGKMAEYTDIAEGLFRQDIREKNYTLLPVDFLFMFHCLWMDLKSPFKKTCL